MQNTPLEKYPGFCRSAVSGYGTPPAKCIFRLEQIKDEFSSNQKFSIWRIGALKGVS